jgi:hypothetical protein
VPAPLLLRGGAELLKRRFLRSLGYSCGTENAHGEREARRSWFGNRVARFSIESTGSRPVDVGGRARLGRRLGPSYDRAVPFDDDALGELLDRVGIGLDLNSAGPVLEPVIAALIDDSPPATLRMAANQAVEALWDPELQAEVRRELTAFQQDAAEMDDKLAETLDAALGELGRPLAENHVAHALVWRATAQLMQRANRNYDLMAELEDALAKAKPNHHRALTLPVAAAASLAADIDEGEAAKAIARHVIDVGPRPSGGRRRSRLATARLARALATNERRRSMRTALAELANMAADEFPRAAGAVNELLAEPVPDDPARDELWVSLVLGFAEDQVAGALSADIRG